MIKNFIHKGLEKFFTKGLWLAPMDISITDAAESIGVSRKTLSKIINKKGKITPEMAVRLSISLGSSPESWMGHQTAYDLWKVEQHKEELNVHPIRKMDELAGHSI